MPTPGFALAAIASWHAVLSAALEITLESNPLATNPKSSELTALSMVRLIEH